ncbi:MAG: PEP-CTERM sorting domain-containing protein [Phycisphaerae bacterium]|jgi:hypothetical protein|nr:PEP-CTERM sorting domain-containing protein [Phycisphaerae bacterium]
MIIRGTSGIVLTLKSWLVLGAVFGALCLSPAPAAADFISFDMGAAVLDYDVVTRDGGTSAALTGTLIVSDTLGSNFQVRRHDDDSTVLDTAEISGVSAGDNNFDLSFTLNLVKEAGTDQWSATGTLTFTDVNEATNAAEASFTSGNILIINGELWIDGLLSNNSPLTSILRNSTNPWVFVGENDIGGEPSVGDAGQISVSGPDAYDDGSVLVLKSIVTTDSLDTLFDTDFNIAGDGSVKGSITPEPATMGLVALGGLVVLTRRRRK